MKSLLLASLLVLTHSAFAVESASEKTVYEMPHQIALQNLTTPKECKNEDGKWSKEDDMCFADAADVLTIEKSAANLKVSISTITTNGHQCEFESEKAVQNTDGTISASAASSIYDENGNESPALCDVNVKFNKNGTASATPVAYEPCQMFCGANASLDIDGAVKSLLKPTN